MVSLTDCDPPPLPEKVIERIVAACPKAKPQSSAHLPAADDGSGVVASALNAMLSMDIVDQGDGSKRLFACMCRAVEQRKQKRRRWSFS